MRFFLTAILLCTALTVVSQQPTQKFEPAIVVSVEEHKNPEMKADGTGRQYKVGLRTATHIYVVLFTPAYGSKTVEYSVGNQVSVLVMKKVVRFNDISGTTLDMPILSTRKIERKTSD